MGLEVAIQKAAQIRASVGRAALHTLMPDDFEFYSCTLELLDSQGNIEGSLVFPVMPNNISSTNSPAVNVKKTAGGVVSLVNNNFTPTSISLQGTFGRKFRILVQADTDLLSGGLSLKNLGSKLKAKIPIPGFNPSFKNGYGTLKIMESIIDESTKLDAYGNPKLLFFYNQAFNHNHLVEVVSFTNNQSLESNMIWNYSLEMKTLALAENISLSDMSKNKRKKLAMLLAIAVINTGINNILGNLSAVGLKNKAKTAVDATINKIKAGR